jgi:hypothetical protein
MGVVYKALQLDLNRFVALKMIQAAGPGAAEARARFRVEAQAIARLHHPNIVQIYEVREHGGMPFFSMEYCPGGNLAGKLACGPLEPRHSARLIQTLALAIQAAHQARVIHRDLKPSNVLLAADGTPKIADFGLARKMDDADRTRTGVVMGTPSYMAPEQARGRRREVGPAADVYALGAILYECLSGKAPFKGENDVDTVLQVVSQPPVPPSRWRPHVPRALEAICLRCLRKEPSARYATAQALADDLERFLGEAGKPDQREWRAALGGWLAVRSRRSLAALAVVLVVLVVGLALVPTPAPGAAAAAATSAAAASRGDLYGVIVGVSAEVNPTPAENALAVYRALLRQKGGLYRQVHLSPPLLDDEATRGAILNTLWQQRRKMRPADRMLVYLSGKGVSLNELGKAFIFATSDADLDERPGSGLTGRDLLRVLAALPGRSCVIIDATGAGGLVDDLRAVRLPAAKVPVILAACNRGEDAYATDELKLGLFTDGLLRAIAPQRRADRTGDGLLDVREAFAAAAERVAAQMRELRARTGERLVQQPRLHLPRGARWPLARLRPRQIEEPFIIEEGP